MMITGNYKTSKALSIRDSLLECSSSCVSDTASECAFAPVLPPNWDNHNLRQLADSVMVNPGVALSAVELKDTEMRTVASHGRWVYGCPAKLCKGCGSHGALGEYYVETPLTQPIKIASHRQGTEQLFDRRTEVGSDAG